ncbi:Uncharacterised protein [uncultured Leptotrichia sp.]|nr:Uncharacterised protein [uncultured Leptotrichia sp.]
MALKTKKFGKMLLLNIKSRAFFTISERGNMKEAKARGVKKGQTPAWNVGRKTKPGFENKKISVALPAWMWAELTERAEKQEITRNRLIKNILEIYLKK